MAFKPGKIYQEIIEVEDNKKGMGCFAWLLISIVVLIILFYALGFILTHPFISMVGIVSIVFIVNYFRK
ncbi:conserved hypothetical protein [Carnobacterium maltaromaticum]|uniref:hypothetical protein n=1 Tax=Carnobacterium maltaromaticum TaxID=2751 RepID=UPI00070516DE|nr:hypothetical protein [Carnobacterium maltaromaticum]KRN74146.1 hypothetical protein IV76_GL000278 [Carnobacterium maltaromaticum]CRH19707.1 conserved hypothetical protein [Carnobacterium maltaromaticum]